MSSGTNSEEFDVAGLVAFLKTKEGVLNVIEQLRGRINHRWSFETLKKYMEGLVESHGVFQSTLISGSEKLTLHRARHIEEGKQLTHLKELGARNVDDTKDHGRCHWPSNPLCYCSLYEDIALTEVGAERGQKYVITTYQVINDLIVLPIGELDYFRRTENLQLGGGDKSTLTPYKKALEGEDGILKALIDAFFADEFIKPARCPVDYKLTSALSQVLFESEWATISDAIFYPSVAFRGGSNFAIRPDAVCRKLKLLPEETRIVAVKDVLGYGIFELEVEVVLNSVSESGDLRWEAA